MMVRTFVVETVCSFVVFILAEWSSVDLCWLQVSLKRFRSE